jgi:vitamin B12 transporter
MARRTLARQHSIFLFALSLILAPLIEPPAAQAANPAPLSGVVIDRSGTAIAGARVTAIDTEGAIVSSTTSDGSGAFSLRGLPPGAYVVLVEMSLFSPWSESVVLPEQGALPTLRATLDAGGFAETVVVTARRVETRLAETPQKIEIVDGSDISRSVAADLTDLLKKNAGVDVVQYSGALSGIGIRGFRPQFSGINKRSLLLLDGRPSGVTNLATLLFENVERVEIVKGAASAVYGSSAMGGVVNVITRQSRGRMGGNLTVGGGSFGTSKATGRVGGNISERVDVDVTGHVFDQRHDYRMGNGTVRPATSYETYDGTLRLGVEVARSWRVEGRANGYWGRDVMTPGDIASGLDAQGSKDLERSTGDLRLTGRLGRHALSLTAFGASERSDTSNVTTTNPADRPYLPYLSFESDLSWAGAQVKDAWTWSRSQATIVGADYEKVTSVSRSFSRTGDRSAPFSADSHKRSFGAYVEHTLRMRDGGTVATLGGRIDRITNETVDTPFKDNFVPSGSTFTVFNPSIGLKHEVGEGLRAHFTYGRGFIPAEATMLTGFTTSIIGGRTQITQGNPELRPERSTSLDVGLEWSAPATRVDVTAFRTLVTDRFISNVVVSSPPSPAPIVVSVENGLDAHISGLDVEVAQRLGGRVGVYANLTHYFTRKERLTTGTEQDILNVPQHTVRAGVDFDLGRIGGRLSGRYVLGRKDNDFSQPGFPIVDNEDFLVVDATADFKLARQHAVVLGVGNLFDAFYYEKLGFPLQGVSFTLSYRLGF